MTEPQGHQRNELTSCLAVSLFNSELQQIDVSFKTLNRALQRLTLIHLDKVRYLTSVVCRRKRLRGVRCVRTGFMKLIQILDIKAEAAKDASNAENGNGLLVS